jgi:hypothetical protein
VDGAFRPVIRFARLGVPFCTKELPKNEEL